MTSLWGFLIRYALILIGGGLLCVVYSEIIQPSNIQEMHPLQVDLEWILVFVIWNMVAALVFPSKLEKPSDCFLLVYSLLVLMTGAVTWGASGVLSLREALILLAFLSVSAALYRSFVHCGTYLIGRYLLIPYMIRMPSYIKPALILLLVGVVAGILSGQPGSFSLSESYARRILGRESFPDRAFISYAFLITVNGVAPFLAFLATVSKRYWVLLFPLAFELYAFWLVGVKEPILLVIVMAGLGFFFRIRAAVQLPIILLICLVGLLIGALIEHDIMGYSYTADYFVRRAFTVTGQVQSYYADYILRHMEESEWLAGAVAAKGRGASMLIGSLYFGSLSTNANTNMFLYTFLQQGLIGWLVGLVFISIVYSFLDKLQGRRSEHVAMSVAFLYAILLAEQNYSTAFVSSGIGVLCVLIILCRNGLYGNLGRVGSSSS